MRRTVDRGEIAASADIETVSEAILSIAVYRALIQAHAIRPGSLISLIDGVVLPALLNGSAAAATDPTDRSS